MNSTKLENLYLRLELLVAEVQKAEHIINNLKMGMLAMQILLPEIQLEEREQNNE